jgi:type IV pilus assembly protein PilN
VIRVNLLANDRQNTRKKFAFHAGQKLTVGCSLILVAGGLYVGWRYWALDRQSAALDSDIAAAQQQTIQLRSIIAQVQQYEQRKAQLQERVTLIEQLRKAQTGPVHMLDQISRSLPPMLWLTEMKQGASPEEVLLEGRCQTLTGLSDFVAGLEQTGYFKRSVEIVSTTAEAAKPPIGELIKFQIKAVFQRPGDRPQTASVPVASTPEVKPRG